MQDSDYSNLAAAFDHGQSYLLCPDLEFCLDELLASMAYLDDSNPRDELLVLPRAVSICKHVRFG